MRFLFLLLLMVVVALNLTGCHTLSYAVGSVVQEQMTSDETRRDRVRRIRGPETVEVVDLVDRVGGKKVSVGEFSSVDPGRKAFYCRLTGAISPPSDQTYEEYFRDVLVEHLKSAGVYDPQSPVVLVGRIEELDYSTSSDYWKVVLRVAGADGSAVVVDNKYEYKVSFWAGDNACTVARREMPFAVTSTVQKLVRHKDFTRLFGLDVVGRSVQR